MGGRAWPRRDSSSLWMPLAAGKDSVGPHGNTEIGAAASKKPSSYGGRGGTESTDAEASGMAGKQAAPVWAWGAHHTDIDFSNAYRTYICLSTSTSGVGCLQPGEVFYCFALLVNCRFLSAEELDCGPWPCILCIS